MFMFMFMLMLMFTFGQSFSPQWAAAEDSLDSLETHSPMSRIVPVVCHCHYHGVQKENLIARAGGRSRFTQSPRADPERREVAPISYVCMYH